MGTGLRLSLLIAIAIYDQISQISRKSFGNNLTRATYADYTRLWILEDLAFARSRLQEGFCEFSLNPSTRVSVRSVEIFLVEMGKKTAIVWENRRLGSSSQREQTAGEFQFYGIYVWRSKSYRFCTQLFTVKSKLWTIALLWNVW